MQRHNILQSKRLSTRKDKTILIIFGVFFLCIIGLFANNVFAKKTEHKESNIIITQKLNDMKLGAFSASLSVKDLKASKEFYKKLGFTVLAGSMEKNYLIMKNGNALVGLFQGMLEGNILTFNPGWDENGKNVDSYDDIRYIQKQLKNSNLELISEADENSEGPASLMLKDPDGNMILIDQHR